MSEGLDASPPQLLHRAQFLLHNRQIDAAIRLLDEAESAGCGGDTCAASRWTAYMLRGDFAAAWRESDGIWRRAAYDAHRFWQGEELSDKRVLVRCLHGFGDAVQFLRYVPSLQRQASALVIEVPPDMVELARCFAGVERVLTWSDKDGRNTENGLFHWDVQCEIMELPYLFRTHLSDLPLAVKYLQLPATVRQHARRAIGRSPALRVGVVWAAGDWNADRSVSLGRLAPILRIPGCEFWNLQGGAARREWDTLALPCLRDAAVCGDGMVALAAAIAEMDLVLTVDTLAAHLAGAMGIAVWVLLQHAADWRWMMARSDSPWYPSLRLFRQPSPDDWESVLSSVQRAMEELVKTTRSPVRDAQ